MRALPIGMAGALFLLWGCAPPPAAPAPERLPKVPAAMVAERANDADFKAATEKAQGSLDSFLSRLKNPQRGEVFSIEAKFMAADGSPVYLWLGDVAFKNGRFEGRVTSNPNKATDLKIGDAATVKREDVTDWMILQGGRSEGGFTTEVWMRREGQPR